MDEHCPSGPGWRYTPDGWRQDAQVTSVRFGSSALTAPDVVNLIAGGIAHSKSMGLTPIGIQLGLECYRLLWRMANPAAEGDFAKIAEMFGLPVSMAHEENQTVVRVLVSFAVGS